MKEPHFLDSYLIIGAGKVGQSIADYLKNMGIDVYIYTHNVTDKLSNKYGNNIYDDLSYFDDLPAKIFICVDDNSINQVSKELAEVFSYDLSWKTIVHTSGILTSDVLSECKEYGAFTASLHPYQTFARGDKDLLQGIMWGLESDYGIDSFKVFLKEVKFKYQVISKENKTQYHLSACILSNYLFALLDSGGSVLKSVGGDFKEFALPILMQTIDNYINFGASSMTGPIARGDIETVKAHLDSLKDSPELVKSYSHFGLALLDTAETSFPNKTPVFNDIKVLLNERLKT